MWSVASTGPPAPFLAACTVLPSLLSVYGRANQDNCANSSFLLLCLKLVLTGIEKSCIDIFLVEIVLGESCGLDSQDHQFINMRNGMRLSTSVSSHTLKTVLGAGGSHL